MAEEIEILLMNPVSETLSDGLAGGYRVARLWEAEDPERLLATRGPAIRGLVTGGHVGAGRALIDRLPALEIIAVHGVGYDKVDLEAARARAIAISHTPDVLTDDVADLAVGLAIAQTRRICEGDRHVRDGLWASARLPLARKFSERRCGILGLGRIGTAIARRLEGFGREVLDALGPDGLLVNVARGSIVDEDALVAALAEGRLGGAALDVFADEPKVPAALCAMTNVVLTPHVASGTVETRRAMGALVLANLEAHFAGRPLPTEVPL